MTQLNKLKESLENKYGVPIEEFLEHYKNNKGIEWLSNEYSIGWSKIRTIFATLNLRLPKKYRVGDLALLRAREESTVDIETYEEIKSLNEDIEEYEKVLLAKEKALATARREVNRYRKSLRNEALEDVIIDTFSTSLSSIKPIERVSFEPTKYAPGSDFMLVSDVHAGAFTSTLDVPDSPYNWDIMISRLERVFASMVHNKTADVLDVIFAGDMVQGIIHGAEEFNEKPIALVLSDLATLLSSMIGTLKEHYTTIKVHTVNGNHSRLTDKIKTSTKGLDYEFLMYKIMEAQLKEVVDEFNIVTCGMGVFTVGTKRVGFHHGDHFRGAHSQARDENILARFSELGTPVDHLMQGHTHIYESHIMPNGGISITNGATSGIDTYVHTSGIRPVKPIQVIGSFDATGNLRFQTPVILG